MSDLIVERIRDRHLRLVRLTSASASSEIVEYMNRWESGGARYITYVDGVGEYNKVILISGEANVCMLVVCASSNEFANHLYKVILRINESWRHVNLESQFAVSAWRWDIRDDVLLRVSSVDYNTFMIVPSFFNARSVAQSETVVSWHGSAITESGEVITL